MDTLSELHQQQIAKEMEIREASKAAAVRVVKAHGKKRKWRRKEVLEMIQMLGLDEPSRLPPTYLTSFNNKVN